MTQKAGLKIIGIGLGDDACEGNTDVLYEAKHTRTHEATLPISPSIPCETGGNDDRHDGDEEQPGLIVGRWHLQGLGLEITHPVRVK